jgi:hypothetical protein
MSAAPSSPLPPAPAPAPPAAPVLPWLARHPWAIVVAASLLLFLRKPWALHTPQLWAEDGSIFLLQDNLWGAGVILDPYNGYLHLLPRLIVWLARHLADVAWWPAFYNGAAFAVTVGLFARLASARVALPAAVKPWLVLALPLVVGTGEVLINLTNVQWIAALFLVAHLFAPPARSLPGHAGDIALLVLAGLTGLFSVILLPLFLWRAARHRTPDTLLAAAVVAACGAVQLVWLLRTGTAGALEGAEASFRPLMALSVLGSRLVTWPLLGPAAVRAWPVWVHAALAVVVIAPLLAVSLRAGPHRSLRATLVAAFLLLTAACALRVRADTWPDDNLVNGDRYFYLSRVLLTWLVLLQFGAAARPLRVTARVACGLGMLTHLPHFVLPAPPDYRWAEHCAPLRRGEPARIPTLPEGWTLEYPGRPPR